MESLPTDLLFLIIEYLTILERSILFINVQFQIILQKHAKLILINHYNKNTRHFNKWFRIFI